MLAQPHTEWSVWGFRDFIDSRKVELEEISHLISGADELKLSSELQIDHN